MYKRSSPFFFFRMAYLNAWLTSFVGYTLLCSLLGWTTRGSTSYTRFRMFDWLTTSPVISPCSLREVKWVLLRAYRVWLSYNIHGTDGLESPPKDLAISKRLAKRRHCRGGIWTHVEPPVWKFAVYTLALRPLGHDSSIVPHSKIYRSKRYFAFIQGRYKESFTFS